MASVDTGENLLQALRLAEQQLASRRAELQATDHSVEDRRRELVTATAERDQAMAYNGVMRQQNETMDAEVSRLQGIRASLQEETTVLMGLCEAAEGQLALLITEKIAQLKSLRGELAALS